MTTRPVSRRPLPQRSRGAVLFVALIMLLLLTLLGVTAAQVTVMQERMSGNFRVQQLAFERSESALAAGRDIARDPLQAYDTISDVPKVLGPNNTPPWNSWLTTFPSVEQSETSVRNVPGFAQRLGGGIGEDPNRKPHYYIITAQEKDLPSADADTAAWATNQTVYVF
ncbi:MAG: PilX N-terminal domain-containing pilus assembly protein [Rhodanobacteraceae bacterium]